MITLKQVIEETDNPVGKCFDLFIQALIILSLITFSLETIPDLPDQYHHWLHLFEVFSVLVFTVEYVLRIAVATKKRAYIFSFFGLTDLAAILPFYFGLAIDLRSIRSFRMLRLLRILKITRTNKAFKRFKAALTLARDEIVMFMGLTAILLFLSSVGIYYFESDAQPQAFGSVFHAFWWAVSTLTTVGYGDVYPITLGGRIFTILILFVGLGVVSGATGIVASALTQARALEKEANQSISL